MKLPGISRTIVIVAVIAMLAVAGVGSLGFIRQAQAAELEGTAANVTSGNLLINGKVIIITGNTTIEGDITSGSMLVIKARVQADGSMIAYKIKVKGVSDNGTDENDENEDENELSGVITGVNFASDNATPTGIVIDGKTVRINGDTKIKGTLAVGAKAEVETIIQNGTLVAAKIEIEKHRDGVSSAKSRREISPDASERARSVANHNARFLRERDND